MLGADFPTELLGRLPAGFRLRRGGQDGEAQERGGTQAHRAKDHAPTVPGPSASINPDPRARRRTRAYREPPTVDPCDCARE